MKCLSQNAIETSPFSLVSLAYQGSLRPQGIPGNKALITAHRNQKICASDLVRSAVKANLISAEFPVKQGYLEAVENSFLFYYLSHPKTKSTLFIGKILSRIKLIFKRVNSLLASA